MIMSAANEPSFGLPLFIGISHYKHMHYQRKRNEWSINYEISNEVEYRRRVKWTKQPEKRLFLFLTSEIVVKIFPPKKKKSSQNLRFTLACIVLTHSAAYVDNEQQDVHIHTILPNKMINMHLYIW